MRASLAWGQRLSPTDWHRQGLHSRTAAPARHCGEGLAIRDGQVLIYDIELLPRSLEQGVRRQPPPPPPCARAGADGGTTMSRGAHAAALRKHSAAHTHVRFPLHLPPCFTPRVMYPAMSAECLPVRLSPGLWNTAPWGLCGPWHTGNVRIGQANVIVRPEGPVAGTVSRCPVGQPRLPACAALVPADEERRPQSPPHRAPNPVRHPLPPLLLSLSGKPLILL